MIPGEVRITQQTCKHMCRHMPKRSFLFLHHHSHFPASIQNRKQNTSLPVTQLPPRLDREGLKLRLKQDAVPSAALGGSFPWKSVDRHSQCILRALQKLPT